MSGHDGRRGYIYHLAVLLNYRNRGIAKKLVDYAMKALDREGINKVGLVAFGKILDLLLGMTWCIGIKIFMSLKEWIPKMAGLFLPAGSMWANCCLNAYL